MVHFCLMNLHICCQFKVFVLAAVSHFWMSPNFSPASVTVCLQEMIQLEGIPNLSGMVQSFDQQRLANFCRILSVTISEPDVGNDDKHTLLAKNAQQKRNACPSRAEVNQGA